VQGVRFRVPGSGLRFRIYGSGIRVQGREFSVQGSEARFNGLGFRG